MIRENQTVSISILSGKGGVGKTNLALNLSYALYNMGRSLMIMDCDLGLANLDVLLGVSPDLNLQDLLRAEINAKNVLYPIEPRGFDFLPAASGVPELVEMDEDIRAHLLQKLNSMFRNYNYLMLDLGAGISSTVLSFAAMTRKRIIVLTPEPTSLTDSYALIKVLATKHDIRDFLLVVNQVSSQEELKQTTTRITNACEKFLDIRPVLLGHIRHDPMVTQSVRRQVPLLKFAPRCKASLDIIELARKIDALRQQMLPQIVAEHVLNLNFDFPED
ncbi:MAG: MinD/ParA family protein [Desulfovibrionales bacterium]